MQQSYGPPPQGGYHQPGYGPPMPPPKKGMGGGMIALIVIGCMFGGCVVLGAIGSAAKKSDGEQATTPGAPQAKAAGTAPVARPKPQAMAVTAVDLLKEYERNEVAADDRYKGKALLVTGNVGEVKKDFTDSIVVSLRTPNPFTTVDAHVEDSEKSKAARLNKGESVTLRCEGNGMIIGSPQLGDCTVE